MSSENFWWMNVLDTVTSFLWDPVVGGKVEQEEEITDMASEGAPVKNKSALYNLLAAQGKDEKKEDDVKESVEEQETKEDTEEKTPKKNVSSLYKIISNQNIRLKNPEEIEGIEYHEIVENPHFEKQNQEAVAENALYFVEETPPTDGGPQGRKTSFFEITLNQPLKTKRSQSVVGPSRPQSSPDISTMRKTASSNDQTDMGHLSSISFSFLDVQDNANKEFTYDIVDGSKVSLDLSERGYVPMNEGSQPEVIYSSPRSSIAAPSREVSPGYVGPDPDPSGPKDAELFYAASEVMSRRPPTPFGERTTSRDDYEDVELENRELPPLPSPNPDDYADVDVGDYCRHRDEFPKKLDTLVRGKTVNLVKVRSKLNRAWKSVKNMMNQEKDGVQFSSVPPKSPEPEPESPESPYSCLSENSDYFSERSKPSADDCAMSVSDVDTYSDLPSRSDLLENGLTTLLRRRRDGSGATSPFRKSRHFPEVSRASLE